MIRIRRPAYALIIWLSAMSALAACSPLVPATVPPYINNTPGAFVVVTDKQFDAGLFRLRYPPAWSIVKTSPADAEHIQVYFLAPDGGNVSLTQVEAVNALEDQHLILQNGVIIRVSIDPAAEPSAGFAAQVRHLIASIRS